MSDTKAFTGQIGSRVEVILVRHRSHGVVTQKDQMLEVSCSLKIKTVV